MAATNKVSISSKYRLRPQILFDLEKTVSEDKLSETPLKVCSFTTFKVAIHGTFVSTFCALESCVANLRLKLQK